MQPEQRSLQAEAQRLQRGSEALHQGTTSSISAYTDCQRAIGSLTEKILGVGDREQEREGSIQESASVYSAC